MPLTMPIKSTDRRRQRGPVPMKRAGATPSFATPGGTTFTDRRNAPSPGMRPYVRMGGPSTSSQGGTPLGMAARRI